MRKIITLLPALFACLLALAQQGSISGKITDTSYKKPQPLATITVFKAADTTLITYRLSSPDGSFKVPGLPLNVPLRFIVTFAGFDAYRQEFTLTEANAAQVFDSVGLVPSSKELDDVVVIAERPPVMIKKDTIEFNATAFKTLPNALLEDLLKKLPGVMVDADGNIMVNGKPVNRILVDGKNFFGDDPKMSTRNLPANIINKVQVMDDKEEALRNGDDNMNNVGKVVNITLKKGVKKGWFGKAYAGAGTNERYEAGGIVNTFRDTLQLSLLGYANNLNKTGFSYGDLSQTGGFSRSRSNSSSMSTSMSSNSSGGSSISINGINFGGMQSGGGVTTSSGGGFNLNHAPNDRQSFFAQYFYGHANTIRKTASDVQQFSGDTVTTNSTSLTGNAISNAHNIGVGARLKPDSLTNILFNANYTLSRQQEARISDVYSFQNKQGDLSRGNINQNNLNNIDYYRHSFNYTRLGRNKKGRRISLSTTLDINSAANDYTTLSDLEYINPSPYDTLLHQLRKERVPRTTASGTVVYREPIVKWMALTVSSRYDYEKLTNTINTFNPATDGKLEQVNELLSSRFNRLSNRWNTSAGLQFTAKDVTITPTIRGLWQSFDNKLAGNALSQSRFNLLPALSVAWKSLFINYDKGIVLPSYTYLIPVTNNTNPYYVVKTNPDLLPAERHNVSVSYFANNTRKNLSANIWFDGSFTNNDVIQNIMVDDKGIQTTTPVNADGTKSFYLNYNIRQQYKIKEKFRLSWNIGASDSYDRSQLLYNGENSWQSTIRIQQWAGIDMNFNDKIEWNNSYSLNNNFTRYTSKTFSPLNVNVQGFSSELIVRWPKHVIWENNCNYYYNSNISNGQPKDVFRWNAAVNITCLKDEKGVIKLSAFDILNTNRSIYMSATRNMVTTTRSNVLSQYFMLSFTYNIRAIGGEKKKVGGEKLFMF